MINTTAATRKVAAGTKVYVHSNCDCKRVTGTVVTGVDTVQGAEAYAAEQGFPLTLCKTSRVEETPEAPEVPAEEEQEAGEAEFEVIVENQDQYGPQRRGALAALVEAMGAEMVFRGIKNKNKTGNAAFRVTVTKAPRALQAAADRLLAEVDREIPEVVEAAKSEGAANGWDSNTREKHWKNSARRHITAKGAELVAKLA